VAGLLLALPGFFDWRLAYGMLVWDGLVIAAALWDGMRLPAPQLIVVDRAWNNAPSLDSETEIDLGVEQRGGTILDCHAGHAKAAGVSQCVCQPSLSAGTA
jgi:hypothetical protein